MAFLGRTKSKTHQVKSAKAAKAPKAPKAPKMSRKEKKAAKIAAMEANAMSAAASAVPTHEQAQIPVQNHHSAYAENHSMTHASYNEPRMGDLTVGDYANGMPKIRLGEFFNSFARQLPWVILLFLIGTLGAWYLTKDFKRTYSGEGRILVQLGDEYVYDSVTSKQSAGLQLTPDHIVQNEVGIMKNADIIEQVVGEMTSPGSFGPQRFAKEKFAEINASRGPIEEQNAWVDLYREVEDSFVVMPKPKSSIVDLVYKHEDPEIAVATLNTFIEKYLDARKALFVEGSSDIISERRRATEQQLATNERAIASFLRKNGVSDFDSERGGVTKRTEELRTQLNTLRGEMTETERALATVENQLRAIPEQIDLYVDDRASQRIAQAELELKQLLAKYLPGSPPVRQKETELNELKSLLASNAGRAAGGRRVGPNPVYQSSLTNRNALQSRADSLREKEYVLQRQLDAADAKVRRLQDISPTYANLLRERETLDERLKNYTAKEQEALVNQEQAEGASENVQVISYATRPRKGRNMRLVMFALASAGWGFTLFILAMMKVFLDPKLYAAQPAARGHAGTGRRGSDGFDDRRHMQPHQQPYAQPSYAPPTIPESVPVPAAAFAVAPQVAAADYGQGYEQGYVADQGQAPGYAGQGYADTAPQHSNPYDAQPYTPGYETSAYQQPYGGGYGNAAEDLYANPYLQQPAVQPAPMQHGHEGNYDDGGVPVLGTVPAEPV